jgi:hypothetical protein
LIEASSTPMSRYIILNTRMSTYDELNEKGGIRGANHRIDELSRVDDLEAYRINLNSTAIENRVRPMITGGTEEAFTISSVTRTPCRLVD